MRTAILTAALVIAGAVFALPAKDLVEIRMRGHFFMAPATVPVTVAVEPGAQNRMLVVEVDSDVYFRSSAVELAGENEKRLHFVEFRSLPEGQYTIRARVLSTSDVLGTAVGRLVVMGMTPVR